MAVPTVMADLSTTAASNSPAGSEAPTSTDDFHRAIQSILRHTNAKGSDIASATTTNIGAATGEFVDVTGTTTITGLGTIAAGIVRTVRFTGALTLTHNATSLILPNSANITTAANDTAIFRSLGSGNWILIGGTVLAPSDVAYDATSWNGNLESATKNAIRDKIESMSSATVNLTGDQNIDGNKTFDGNVTIDGAGGLGYATGSGGSVTQLTNKGTAVTLNKYAGQITMNNAALASNTVVSFNLNNNLLESSDIIIINHKGGGTVGNYNTWVQTIANVATIFVRNITGGSLSDALVLGFVVIKGAAT